MSENVQETVENPVETPVVSDEPTDVVPAFVNAAATSGSLDDIIPPELIEAVQKGSEDTEDQDEEDTTEVAKPASGTEVFEDELQPKETASSEEPVVIGEDEELDLSATNIDKLISEGDVEAIRKKTEGDTDTPFWHDEEEYKSFLEEYHYVDLDITKLDTIIKSAAEKASVENKKYTDGLQQQIEDYKGKVQAAEAEKERLKTIERAAYFDNLPETVDKYSKPMNTAVSEITRILQTEGVNVTNTRLLAAKDRTELTKLLENSDIPDEINTQLVNHWRNYKQLQFEYLTDKKSSMENMANSLNTTITPEVSDNVLKTSLVKLLRADTKYGYIDEAIKDGLDPNSDVAEVISKAKGNFLGILDAVANPTEYSRNTDWLENLSTFFLRAAHNENIEPKYNSLRSELQEKEASLKKVVNAYLELRNSARGISGATGGAYKVTPRTKATAAKEDKAVIEELEGILSGDIKMDDILPS